MIRRLLSEALACFVAAALLPKPWLPPIPKREREPLRFWLPQRGGRTAEVVLLEPEKSLDIFRHRHFVGTCSKCHKTTAGVRGDHSLECIPCRYPCPLCPAPDPSLS